MRTKKDLEAEQCTWFLGYGTRRYTLEEAKAYVFGSVGSGWNQLLALLIDSINLWCSQASILQVKEKFGGLRFYHGGMIMKENLDGWYVPDLSQWIACIEALSLYVCEYCGKPGRLREENRFWIKTLCDKCDTENFQPGEKSG